DGTHMDFDLSLAGKRGAFVRVKFVRAGQMEADEIIFGDPPDDVPACRQPTNCEPVTGQCVFPNQSNDTPCDDHDLCTTVDTCQEGACAGTAPVVCSALDQCHDVGACQPALGN